MKYLLFAGFSVGLSTLIMFLSLWRQGQEAIFPQVSYSTAIPTPLPNQPLVLLSPALTAFAASYTPKILPLKPLYLPKMVWQRLALMFPRSQAAKQAILLDRAEERMLIALYLWQHNSTQNADANLLKSQHYLLKAAQVNSERHLERLRQMQAQHLKILESLPANTEFMEEALSLNKTVESLITSQ